MGAGHAHALHVHGHTPVHRLVPEAKVAATFAFVVSVALTPPSALGAFAVQLVALVAVMTIAKLRPGFVLRRVSVVLPFIAFALAIPFIASGERTQLLGLQVSAEGLLAARGIVCKALLGVGASVLLAATTETPAIMRGLTVLRVPPVLTTIATFMIRYLEVLAGELRRMRIAMTARGYDPRWLWQARPVAASAGALFVRSYERGERVHAAMLARGFDGAMPVLDDRRSTPQEWLVALALPAAGFAALAVAVIA